MSLPFLRVEGLSKRYPAARGGPSVPVFEGLSFDIERGRFVCIIGHSGCGKTTILNVLAGLESATSGNVFMAGREVSGPSLDRAADWRRTYLKVPLARAQVRPASSEILASAKHSVAPRCTTRPALLSGPRAGRRKLVFISIVTTPMPACRLRAAAAMATSISVISTPPCTTPNEFRCSGSGTSTTSDTPVSDSRRSIPKWATKGYSTDMTSRLARC
jgi:ABC-type cobalamin/Fe3+-siderophores transport system ATPase subunit